MGDTTRTRSKRTLVLWAQIGLIGLIFAHTDAVYAQKPQAAESVQHVSVNGHAVDSHVFKVGEETSIPLEALSSYLAAQIRPVPNTPDKLTVSLNDHWIQIQLNVRRLVVSTNSESRPSLLKLIPTAPRKWKEKWWIPVSILEFLGATVSTADSSGTVTITAVADDDNALCRRLLGLPEGVLQPSSKFSIAHLDVKPVGSVLRSGKEMVFSLSLNQPGYVQVYIVANQKTVALFGMQDDSAVLYPVAAGVQPKPLKVDRPLHIPLIADQPDVYYYIAIACSNPIQDDPCELLKRGHVAGDWAMAVKRIEVQKSQ